VHFLATGESLPAPRVAEVQALLLAHLEDHYRFYGDAVGVRSARKHIIWYTRGLEGGAGFRDRMNAIEDCTGQARAVDAFFRDHGLRHERLQYAPTLH
jgi:tRNA-dihydrouridine synthase B